jgi:hypothetical protein
LDSEEQQAIIDWHGDSLSVEMDMKWNPIAWRAWEMSYDLMQIALLSWGGGYGTFREEDGYLIYQGFVRLNKDYQHLIHNEMETFDRTEEYVQEESFFEKLPKMIAKQADEILIRKKIKIRAIHCENVYIDKLAENIIHYLIFSDLTERIKSDEI